MRIQQIKPARKLTPQCAQRIENNGVAVCYDKADVTRAQLQPCANTFHLFRRQKFCEGGADLSVDVFPPRQSACTVGFYKTGQRINIFAGKACGRARCDDGAHRAAGLQRL